MIAEGLHQTAPPANYWDAERWPNFSALELACKCGGKHCRGRYFHNPRFLDKLQALRNEIGPLKINSGCRCPVWNRKQGSTAVRSMHVFDIAADIDLTGHNRHALLAAARQVGFKGIGLGLNFLHVDDRETQGQWDYGAASRAAWGLP